MTYKTYEELVREFKRLGTYTVAQTLLPRIEALRDRADSSYSAPYRELLSRLASDLRALMTYL